jgi:hypothetical protein
LSAEVKRKEVELMELRKKQLEIELEAMKKKIERQKEEVMKSLNRNISREISALLHYYRIVHLFKKV